MFSDLNDLCSDLQIFYPAPIFYHALEHAFQGVDSKRRAFEPLLTKFRVFVINRKIERRFIGHHACGSVLFVSQVAVDGAAICVTLVFVHFRFLLSNISRVFAGTRFSLSFNVKLDEAVSLPICF